MSGTSLHTPSGAVGPSSAYKQAFRDVQAEYQIYLPLVQRVQESLREDAAELKAQEGWDLPTQRGIDSWIDDTQTIYRFLQRNDYDEAKTYPKLLDALVTRAERALHQPLPSIPPYSTSDLFRILPLPDHTDICGRPIAVLCPREIKRNEDGELDDLVEWTWWCCEMLRRTLDEYWSGSRWRKGTKARGGEGCVLVVDAAGAGYRNLEVELLPTLTKVGSRNFPGMVQAVFIVNAGWTQRSLWSIVSKMVSKPAIERIKFIDRPAQLEPYFDLAKLPKNLGGTSDLVHDSSNSILGYYSTHSLGPAQVQSSVTSPAAQAPPPRISSFASTAELFFTAENSPATSRQASLADFTSITGNAVHLRKPRYVPSPLATAHPSPELSPEARSPFDDDDNATSSPPSVPTTHAPSRAPSKDKMPPRLSVDTADSYDPLSRIKSLTDFKLYLSPSRLAQVDLLGDDAERSQVVPQRPSLMQRRRTLRPAMLESMQPGPGTTIAQRRSRPSLRILGPAQRVAAQESNLARSYSDRLMRHHAEELDKLDELSPDAINQISHSSSYTTPTDHTHPINAPNISTIIDPPPPTGIINPTQHPAPGGPDDRRISAFSRSLNPYYGYPVRLSPTNPHKIIPPRRRYRDLLKTLLFLFILRLQSLRDTFERFFGLNRLLPWADLHTKWVKARNPEEGLKRDREAWERRLGGAGGGGGLGGRRGGEGGNGVNGVVKRTRESDWVWMGVGLLLVRGGWGRLLAWPLEVLGLEGIRGLFGLDT